MTYTYEPCDDVWPPEQVPPLQPTGGFCDLCGEATTHKEDGVWRCETCT